MTSQPSPPMRRRSCLVVPGSSRKMIDKAQGLDADEIVFDLEDAVAPADKNAARALVVQALQSDAFASRPAAVRINGFDTDWFEEDVTALAGLSHPTLSLILPKVDSDARLAALDWKLSSIENAAATAPLGLQALIETAAGVINAPLIARSTDRLRGLILGYADLASSLGRTNTSYEGWRFIQESLVVAARAAGIQAIDGPHFAFGPEAQDELKANSRTAAGLGFEGKWAIHPSQIDAINTAFTPSPEQVTHARAILDRLAVNPSVSALEGEMVDEAMREGALRILARGGVDK